MNGAGDDDVCLCVVGGEEGQGKNDQNENAFFLFEIRQVHAWCHATPNTLADVRQRGASFFPA